MYTVTLLKNPHRKAELPHLIFIDIYEPIKVSPKHNELQKIKA